VDVPTTTRTAGEESAGVGDEKRAADVLSREGTRALVPLVKNRRLGAGGRVSDAGARREIAPLEPRT
jgi:hypothetical protein